ncbi:TonB-dependent receptor [Flavobacteriaceae bacterium]|nr:TonB-dependent receptor [Flavobacteriaceae bacterium]
MFSHASNKVFGIISEEGSNTKISNVSIYDNDSGLLAISDSKGYYEFYSESDTLSLFYYLEGRPFIEKQILLDKDYNIDIVFPVFIEELSEVVVTTINRKTFELKRLNDVVGTSLYAGKKSEVILVNQSMANLASNNSRQIYSQVAGLNIFQNDDAGLQIHIGGRGLDPNRTSNFNTRQNGYDMSADVLGYPESYYSPPAEALEEIQIVRGAASLQYGTQFGGLVNFILKKPVKNKFMQVIARNTLGSYGLYTNFTSVSGTNKKLSYFAYVNTKKGDGFRDNSSYDSTNSHLYLAYDFNQKTKLSSEVSYLTYLAQQAGGLSDSMFNQSPFQSNRARNWFELKWFLYNIKLEHKISEKTNFSFNFFGLNSQRNALGVRYNRVDQIDSGEERDLIKGDFNNYGFESRLLHNYNFLNKKSIFLFGLKYYKSNNTSVQGPGTDGYGPNFDFQYQDYPYYNNQSNYKYPNQNISLFTENIFYISDRFSLTPGIRYENIKTESDGYYSQINFDNAGNVIFDNTVFENQTRKRSFLLFGLGGSYKPNKYIEMYANASQNYRSVTFSDISIFNPAFVIDPDISDEKGYTIDLGIRGNNKKLISYDISLFHLFYNDRIGFTQIVSPDGNIKSQRGNVGNAVIFGIESIIDFNLNKIFIRDNNFIFNYFINTSVIESEYIKSETNGIAGKRLEFVPKLNIKTGTKIGYKNLLLNIQYTYLSNQFTDSSNSIESNLSGVIGQIPAYDILDFSSSYRLKNYKLEFGINNILDNHYFVRRATGYPGPGIIPSPPRNYYITLELKF